MDCNKVLLLPKLRNQVLELGWFLVFFGDLFELYYKLQNWQQYQQESLQAKQEELLRPYRQKVYAVLQDVIKEQKYTHVFKPTEVIFAEKSDDIALRVLAGLKIPLPKEVSEAIKNAGISSGNGPAQPAPKPTLPPGAKPVKMGGKN